MRTRSATSIFSASAVAAALALAVTGCGDGTASAEAREQCQAAAEQAAAARVARAAYNGGQLGGPRELRRFFGPRVRFLDGSGKLRPYESFEGNARYDFDGWLAHVEGSNDEVGDRMFDARMAVRRDGAPGCD